MLIDYKGHKIFAFSDTHGMYRRLSIPADVDFLITHGPAYSYLDRDLGCKQLFLAVASARPKYHIFGHVHEEGLQRKAMLGGTTFLNVSYFEELRRSLIPEKTPSFHSRRVLRIRPLLCQLNMILCTSNQLLSFFG